MGPLTGRGAHLLVSVCLTVLAASCGQPARTDLPRPAGPSRPAPRPAPQPPPAQPCLDSLRAIGDDRLPRAFGALQRLEPGLRFQPDGEPCLHMKSSLKILGRTVRKDYLAGLSGYEYVKIVNGAGYLLVERFRSREPRELEQLRDALLARTPRTLATEASTRYDAFVSGGDLILMVSSATGYEANGRLMEELRRVY